MTTPTDWWCSFFHGLAAELWHRYPTPEQTEAEAGKVLAMLRPAPGAHLLDVPCGDARHAAALARRGYRVTGVDGSSTLLSYRTPTTGLELLRRDMRELPPGPFDGAYCLGNSFGYLGEDGDRAFLAAVHRALAPGAAFLLDATVLDAVLPQLRPVHEGEHGGIRIHDRVTWLAEDGLLRSEYTFERDGVREQKTAWVRVRTVRELLLLLRSVGFARCELLDPDGKPYVHGAPGLFVRAQR